MQLLDEYCPEGTLADYISNEAFIALKMIKDIASGVHYLHTCKKLVHTRLSLSTIFIKNESAKIGGIARLSS